MKVSVQSLALCAIGVCAANLALAEKAANIDVMTCTRADGTSFRDSVYAYTLDTGSSNPRYFSVYLAGNKFDPWAVEEYFGGGFTSCTTTGLGNSIVFNVKVVDVSSSGVGVDVDAGSLSEDAINQRYTLVTMSYTTLEIGSTSTPELPVSSKEDQKKALAAFKARGLVLPRR
jgi:hypothetical protein